MEKRIEPGPIPTRMEQTNNEGISQAGVARVWALTPRVPQGGQEEAEAQCGRESRPFKSPVQKDNENSCSLQLASCLWRGTG